MHYSSVRVYGIIMRGALRDYLYRNTAEKSNKHRITAQKCSETPTSQFKVLSTPTINLIRISM